MNRYAVLQVFLALAMFVNWQVFQTPFRLWTFGFVSGMACAAVLKEAMA